MTILEFLFNCVCASFFIAVANVAGPCFKRSPADYHSSPIFFLQGAQPASLEWNGFSSPHNLHSNSDFSTIIVRLTFMTRCCSIHRILPPRISPAVFFVNKKLYSLKNSNPSGVIYVAVWHVN